jgi:hypothetical protein
MPESDNSKPNLDTDVNTINFNDYANLFKYLLQLLTFVSIILLIALLLISFTSIIILIYDIIIYIITMFVNPDLSKAFSIDYLSKNILKCTKTNYKDDRYLILSEQKQNLILFNLGSYTIYLLLIYLIFYIIINLFASMSYKTVVGNINDIDNPIYLLFILGVIFIYSTIHLAIYKLIFKPFVYIPYKHIDNNEKIIDIIIADFILIKTFNDDNKKNQVILKDDNFFDILYDFSRIDELNNIFLSGIKNNDANGCLEQQIIIYNLYMYLREYISFDENMQKNFTNYCTTDAKNKPNYIGTDDKKLTFLSMLNNNEIRMIKKYHEELDFYNNIPDENIEYYNILNKSIDKKLREINKNMIIHKETLIPFVASIFYILFIFILNFIVLYMIIQIITSNPTTAVMTFPSYLITALEYIKEYIYEPFFSIFFTKKK